MFIIELRNTGTILEKLFFVHEMNWNYLALIFVFMTNAKHFLNWFLFPCSVEGKIAFAVGDALSCSVLEAPSYSAALLDALTLESSSSSIESG
jgi:hypothetical protein